MEMSAELLLGLNYNVLCTLKWKILHQKIKKKILLGYFFNGISVKDNDLDLQLK